MITWIIIAEFSAALYLIGMALIISTENNASAVLFKFIPMCIGIPLAIAVAAQLLGWPI
jgi:hypothetical protein